MACKQESKKPKENNFLLTETAQNSKPTHPFMSKTKLNLE